MNSIPEREAWITLALTPGIGPTRFQSLLRAFGSPDGALAAPFSFLCAVPGISRAGATAIKEAGTRPTGPRTLETLEQIGARAFIFTDDAYPTVLRDIPDPPMVIFGWGKLGVLAGKLDSDEEPSRADARDLASDRPNDASEAGPSVALLSRDGSTLLPPADPPDRLPACAAIVGTRHPTQYGIDVTKGVASACARAGITVVSGMARGCDAIAHSAVLDAGGTTVGVLGNGFGVIYPAANRALYERVRAEGLLLSEFPPGERPHAGSFPRRNRIISGLARATLVIEAGETSGALITAGTALDQGREVLAVPGPITSAASIGTNRLLRDGATPYLGVDDLLGLFGARSTSDARRTTHDAPVTDPLLKHVPPDGALLDTIVDASGWPVAQVLDRLLEFELEGRVEQRPGRVFRRV
jgi:DNA processing protein